MTKVKHTPENSISSRHPSLMLMNDFSVHEHLVFSKKTALKATLPTTLIIHLGAGGGTGGPIMSNLLRTIAGFPLHMRDNVAYIAVDGDVFEPKNLGRQLCTPADMGKNKVVALLSKFQRVYNLNSNLVMAVPKFLDSVEMLGQLVKLGRGAFSKSTEEYKTMLRDLHGVLGSRVATTISPTYRPMHLVIIDSVDRNVCRKYITEFILDFKRVRGLIGDSALPRGYGVTQISCGNGAWDGQTLVGHISGTMLDSTLPALKFPDGKIDPQVRDELLTRVFFNSLDVARSITDVGAYSWNIPLPGIVHPELIDEELDRIEDAMSCSERAVANIQHLNANNMGAMAAVNYATSLLMQQYSRIREVFFERATEEERDSDSVLVDSPSDTMDFYALKNQGFYFNSLNNAVKTTGFGGDSLKGFEKRLRGLKD